MKINNYIKKREEKVTVYREKKREVKKDNRKKADKLLSAITLYSGGLLSPLAGKIGHPRSLEEVLQID